MGVGTGAGTSEIADDDYVQFLETGDPAAGEFRCSECGYGVTVNRVLPRCPMCSGTAWEQVSWRPFAHRLRQPQPLR